MLEAIRSTAKWTSAKIQCIRELVDATAATIRQQLPKIYSRELAELIFENPYCRIRDLVEANIAKRQTASAYLKAMVTADILRRSQSWSREPVYQSILFKALVRLTLRLRQFEHLVTRLAKGGLEPIRDSFIRIPQGSPQKHFQDFKSICHNGSQSIHMGTNI